MTDYKRDQRVRYRFGRSEALALAKDGRTEDARGELISILEDNSESHGTFFLEASLKLTEVRS